MRQRGTQAADLKCAGAVKHEEPALGHAGKCSAHKQRTAEGAPVVDVVGGQVEVLRPLDAMRGEVEYDDARRDVHRQVELRGQLAAVLCGVVVRAVEEVRHGHDELPVAIVVEVRDGGRAHDVRVDRD